MERLPEGTVGDGKHEVDEQQNKNEDEAHPRERD